MSGSVSASAKTDIINTPVAAEPLTDSAPINPNRIGAAQAGMFSPKASACSERRVSEFPTVGREPDPPSKPLVSLGDDHDPKG